MKLKLILPSLEGVTKRPHQQVLLRIAGVDLTALIDATLRDWQETMDNGLEDRLERMGVLFKEYLSDVDDFGKYMALLRLLELVTADLRESLQSQLVPFLEAFSNRAVKLKLVTHLDGATMLQIEDASESDETLTPVTNHLADRGSCA